MISVTPCSPALPRVLPSPLPHDYPARRAHPWLIVSLSQVVAIFFIHLLLGSSSYTWLLLHLPCHLCLSSHMLGLTGQYRDMEELTKAGLFGEPHLYLPIEGWGEKRVGQSRVPRPRPYGIGGIRDRATRGSSWRTRTRTRTRTWMRQGARIGVV